MSKNIIATIKARLMNTKFDEVHALLTIFGSVDGQVHTEFTRVCPVTVQATGVVHTPLTTVCPVGQAGANE